MIHEDTYKQVDYFTSAKGLVFAGDKILAYRRDTKTDLFPLRIDLPGGGREEGETPFQTFKREAFEEFGVHISEGDLCVSVPFPSKMTPGAISFFMVAKPSGLSLDDVVFGDEGLEWFPMTLEEFIAHPDGIESQQARAAAYMRGEL